MAEKKLLEKLREAYLVEKQNDYAAVVEDFCAFAEKWLLEQAPTGVSYSVAGLMLRLANGDSYVLVPAPESDFAGGAVSVTGMDKLNARAAPARAADFPITGR